MSLFLELLKKKIVIFDGSFGALMREMDVPQKDFNGTAGFTEILNITRPDIISSVTERYFAAGSDVVQTNTFTANPIKVMEFGLPREKTYELNFKAAQIARKAAEKYSTKEKPRFVKGSIGPSGFLPSSTDESLSKITYDELKQNYYEQALGLLDGGVDMFIIETQQDILETKATISGLKKAMLERIVKLPIICQVTLDVSQNMLLGNNIESVLTTLKSYDVEIIGLNCSTGPKEMTDTVRYLCNNTDKFISVIPNAGLPVNVSGKTHYPLAAEEMLAYLKKFVYDFGINIVGACCGSNPSFIELMASEFKNKEPKKRTPVNNYAVSSGMVSVMLEQEPRPLIIGETTNATGSRKFLSLLKEEKYEPIIEMARAQIEKGAHLLDVSTAHNDLERPESYYMEKIVKVLSNTVQSPLVIDSTDHKVIEAALKLLPGKALINSINLEGDGSRVHEVLKLVQEFGGAVIAMTIDGTGMAETKERKFSVAKRIHDIYKNEYNLDSGELFIDVLTFPLTTGEDKYKNSALETLGAIKKIKEELPHVKTILGVSNISFGISLNARRILNSVFVYHALKCGLDAMIINSRHIVPYSDISDEEKKLFEDLIFNSHSDALQKVIEYYENKSFDIEVDACEEESLGVEERLSNKIILRKYEKLIETIDEAREKYSAVEIINNILIPAMREVGDKFGRGEYILPFVLEAAGIMKKAVAYLEQFLEKTDSYTRGKLVLATVYGDVHDIGKNLVKTIVSNNGFTVVDLGKQVPVQAIVEKAKEINADAIGLSALLVSTSKQMKVVIEELDKQKLSIPVIVGGASINSRYAREISHINSHKYEGGVFFAKNAFDGLNYIKDLTSDSRGKLIESYFRDIINEPEAQEVEKNAANQESSIVTSEIIPDAKFFGTRVLDGISLKDIFPYINLEYVFKLHWGVRLPKESYDKEIKEKYLPILEELKNECIEKKYLVPKAVYGYFRCRKEKNSLIILEPYSFREIEKFDFPRQGKHGFLCLSDYFNSERADIVAFHIVTVGNEIEKISERLNNEGDYVKALYLHGLAVETAEAFAEYLNRHIIKELGFKEFQGLRYSFGYPACPELKDQIKLFNLLDAKRIGTKLTESYQITPECSTSAIIVYHKDAKYFGV